MQVTKLWRVIRQEHSKQTTGIKFSHTLTDLNPAWQEVSKNVEFWTDEKEAIASWERQVAPYLEGNKRLGMSYTLYDFAAVTDDGTKRVQIHVDEYDIECWDI